VSETGFIGIVCGLKSEAAAVRRAIGEKNIRIGVSGANARRADEIAHQFCKDGAAAIVSVGVSGGLDPDLRPGDLIIGEGVVAADGAVWLSDKKLLEAIDGYPSPALPGVSRGPEIADAATGGPGSRLSSGRTGTIFGADDIIDSAEKKKALREKFGAMAVDMESHGAARAAARSGVPFLAIRAVADPAERALPPAALNAIAPDGAMRVMHTLLQCAKAPGQFPALLQLGSDSEKALARLRRDLGPLFGRLFLALDL
jgi:nucleoside phosphorylase